MCVCVWKEVVNCVGKRITPVCHPWCSGVLVSQFLVWDFQCREFLVLKSGVMVSRSRFNLREVLISKKCGCQYFFLYILLFYVKYWSHHQVFISHILDMNFTARNVLTSWIWHHHICIACCYIFTAVCKWAGRIPWIIPSIYVRTAISKSRGVFKCGCNGISEGFV